MANRRASQVLLEGDGDWSPTRRASQLLIEIDAEIPSTGQLSWGIEFDWTNDDTWINEAEYVTSIHIERGRSTPFQFFRAGKLTLEMDNSSHRFTPWNTGGDLYGNIKPHRPVRIRLEHDGTTYHLFRGFLEDIEPTGRLGQEKVIVTAYDGFTQLENVFPDIEVQILEYTDTVIGLVLDEVGWPSGSDEGQRALDTAGATVPIWWAGGQDARSLINETAYSEDGLFFFSADGKATFIARATRYSTGADHTLTQANITDIKILSPWEYIANKSTLMYYPKIILDAGAYIALWSLEDDSPQLAPLETITVWAQFYNSDGQLCAATNVQTPVATTDYTANTASDGSGTDMTAYMSVSITTYSTSAKLVISNTNPLPINFYITLLQVRGSPIETSPTAIRVEDSTSQSDYGLRERNYDLPWLTYTDVATDTANNWLNAWKDARKHVFVTLVDRPDLALGYELGDYVDFTSALYDIDEEMMIGSMTIQSLGGVGKTSGMQALSWTIGLEPIAHYTRGWLLGTEGYSELGETTYLGY